MDTICSKCGVLPDENITLRNGVCSECRWKECITCKDCGGEQLAGQIRCMSCNLSRRHPRSRKRRLRHKRTDIDNGKIEVSKVWSSTPKTFVNGINVKSKLTQVRKRHADKEFRGEFDITMEYLTQSLTGQCVFCGRKPTGLDRINSRIGYTQENCQPACGTCNRMKMDMSDDDFIEHVQIMANYFANKHNYA